MAVYSQSVMVSQRYSHKSAATNFTLMLLWPLSVMSDKSKIICSRVDLASQNSHHTLIQI